jgi:hypothetical protein
MIGDGDLHAGVADLELDLELGAGVQHRVVAQFAAEQHRGVDELVEAGLLHGRPEHPARQDRRPRFGRKPHSTLQQHRSSVPGLSSARRSRLESLPVRRHRCSGVGPNAVRQNVAPIRVPSS